MAADWHGVIVARIAYRVSDVFGLFVLSAAAAVSRSGPSSCRWNVGQAISIRVPLTLSAPLLKVLRGKASARSGNVIAMGDEEHVLRSPNVSNLTLWSICTQARFGYATGFEGTARESSERMFRRRIDDRAVADHCAVASTIGSVRIGTIDAFSII
jgi:hypothetical protein